MNSGDGADHHGPNYVVHHYYYAYEPPDTGAAPCRDCRGTGRVALLVSVVPCALCEGTGLRGPDAAVVARSGDDADVVRTFDYYGAKPSGGAADDQVASGETMAEYTFDDDDRIMAVRMVCKADDKGVERIDTPGEGGGGDVAPA